MMCEYDQYLNIFISNSVDPRRPSFSAMGGKGYVDLHHDDDLRQVDHCAGQNYVLNTMSIKDMQDVFFYYQRLQKIFFSCLS